jgi:hypothetical protein
MAGARWRVLGGSWQLWGRALARETPRSRVALQKQGNTEPGVPAGEWAAAGHLHDIWV